MRVHVTLAVATLLASSVLSASAAEPLEIKGFRPGMTRAQAEAAGAKEDLGRDHYKVSDVTVGGRDVYFSLRLQGEVVSVVEAGFKAENFDAIRDAVVGKYRSTRCVPSTVRTGAGETLPSTECTVGDANSVLILSQYARTTRYGMLTLMSRAEWNQGKAKKQEAAKDI